MTGVKRASRDHPRGKRSKHQKTLEHGKEGDEETKFTVVKTTLRSFCTAEARLLPWEHVLKEMNKTIFEAYIVANLHVIRYASRTKSCPRWINLSSIGAWQESPLEEIKDFISSNGGFVKGSSKGPVKKLERRLKQYCKVVPIDEFRTSKLHSFCHTELVNQKSHRRGKDGAIRVTKVHSVLHCRSSGCQGMTVNRDENAARNMQALLEQSVKDGTRPEAFRRSATQHPKVPSGRRIVIVH